jgi:hypothetical protein
MENIEEAVAETKGKLDRFNEIGMEMAEPDADFDALMEEMGKLQEEIDHRTPGTSTPARAGHGRAALPARGHPRQRAVRW